MYHEKISTEAMAEWDLNSCPQGNQLQIHATNVLEKPILMVLYSSNLWYKRICHHYITPCFTIRHKLVQEYGYKNCPTTALGIV